MANSAELDAEWRRLAAEGENKFIVRLEADYQQKIQEVEALLISLRSFAETSLTKKANASDVVDDLDETPCVCDSKNNTVCAFHAG